MKGEVIKALIIEKGYNIAQVAEMIGTSQQNLASNLKHTDVRSGLLEKIADALSLPVAALYGEEGRATIQKVSGNNNTQVAGNSNTFASDQMALELLKTKDEQLTLTIKQVSKAQEQMDRVLDRFCGPQKPEETAEV